MREKVAPLLVGIVIAAVLVGVWQQFQEPKIKRGFGIAFSDKTKQPVFIAGDHFTWPSADCVVVWEGSFLRRAVFQTCGVVAVQRMDEPKEKKP